jgi:uncharacterized membrane protein
MNFPLKASLGLLLATAVTSAVAITAAGAADEEKYEACYGVAKAGHNDCKSSTHICAGKGTADRDPHTFIDLPVGTCAKLAGGALSEPVSDKKK